MPLYRQVYIAFSIHGTKTFITANRSIPVSPVVPKLPTGMKVVKSRNPSQDPSTIKLEWDRLLTKAGKPLRSPPMILHHFNELAEQGWNVDKAAFVKRHYRK